MNFGLLRMRCSAHDAVRSIYCAIGSLVLSQSSSLKTHELGSFGVTVTSDRQMLQDEDGDGDGEEDEDGDEDEDEDEDD